MQAVSVGLVLSAVAGIAPVLMDQVGAGAMSRPARRRPELRCEPRRPFAPRPVHHRAGCVLRRGARRRGAGAAPGAPIGAWPARWSSPARCLDATAGLAADGTAGLRRDRPTRTGCGWLARGRPCALPWPQVLDAYLADYLKSSEELCAQSSAAPVADYALNVGGGRAPAGRHRTALFCSVVMLAP